VSDLIKPVRPSTSAVIELAAPQQLVTVIARRGCAMQVQALVLEHFGMALPVQPRAVFAGNAEPPHFLSGFLWSGPGHWLAMSNVAADTCSLEQPLSEKLSDVASVCDQSGSRVLFSVQGPNARTLLAKGLGVDLHPQSFTPGDVAVSSIGHMGVQLWQVDAAPTYQLLVARSYAESFRHWLQAAGG
jgi:heterotetrameric sarcosine oxidase gamma subunit